MAVSAGRAEFASATGAIAGQPMTPGTYSGLQILVSSVDAQVAASPMFSITVNSALAITGTPTQTGAVGTAYSAQFAAAGGDGNYTYSMIGTLPAGLQLASVGGAIYGTPTTIQTASNLQVMVTDGTGQTATSAAFSIAVTAPALTISGSPGAGLLGVAYAAQFTASGGSGTGYTFALATGALPTWPERDSAVNWINGLDD